MNNISFWKRNILKRVIPNKKYFQVGLFVSIMTWWLILIILFDLQYIRSLRRKISLFPTLSRWDQSIKEATTRVYASNVRFSRPFDVFWLPYFFVNSNLTTYKIFVNPLNLNLLDNSVQRSLRNSQFLTDRFNIWVPIQLEFEGKNYQGELKYRGDRSSHWNLPKKSFSIKLKDQNINKAIQLDFILPEERGYVAAYLSKYVSKKLDLITQGDSFVQVFINNQNFGIYYQPEHIDKLFLKNNNLPIGNIYSDIFGNVDWSSKINLFENIDGWKKIVNNSDKDFQSKDFKLLITALVTNNRHDLMPLLNIDKFINWQIHSILMGNFTQDNQHNMKIYQHPQTDLFEPITNDISFSPDILNIVSTCSNFDISYNQLVNIILDNPQTILIRNQRLWNYLSNSTNKSDDIQHLDNLINDYKKELLIGIQNPTKLQLFHYLNNLQKSLSIWYQKLLAILASNRIKAQAEIIDNHKLKITFITHGPGVYKIKSINKQIQGDVIYPEFTQANNSGCKEYEPVIKEIILPCFDCQSEYVTIEIKNLVNQKEFVISVNHESN